MAEEMTATAGGAVGGANATENSNRAGQEGTETQAQVQTQGNGQESGGGQTAQETFTQADVDCRIQQALETARGKWEADVSERIQQERDDAAKLAQMSEKEKAEEMARRQKESFDTQKAEFERERSVFDAQKQLADRRLPLDFAELLAGKDTEATKNNIDAFEQAFNAAVQEAVVIQMKGSAPQVGVMQQPETDPFLQGFGS